jgi:hypothetical protein
VRVTCPANTPVYELLDARLVRSVLVHVHPQATTSSIVD